MVLFPRITTEMNAFPFGCSFSSLFRLIRRDHTAGSLRFFARKFAGLVNVKHRAVASAVPVGWFRISDPAEAYTPRKPSLCRKSMNSARVAYLARSVPSKFMFMSAGSPCNFLAQVSRFPSFPAVCTAVDISSHTW